MFTMIAYRDATAHAALAALDAVPDPHVRVGTEVINVPELNKMIGAFCGGTTVTEGRIESPSLRRLANQRLGACCTVLLPPATESPDYYFHNWTKNPRTLDVAEGLEFHAVGPGTTYATGLIWLADALAPAPSGEMFTVEATASVTGIILAWVNGALTFSQTLPAGRYAVVGMRATHTNCDAARLVFVGSSWRPGCVGTEATDRPDIPIFRNGGLGSWGEFEHDSPPTIDLLSQAAAATAPDVTLDLIQVRSGRG